MAAEVFMIVGFVLAAYAVVANDSIQTLGTFLVSNRHQHWAVLWGFIGAVLTAVLLGGWLMNDGDVAFGRLESIPYPEHVSWLFMLPPLAVLALTRFGIPVSTTFLILSVFAPKAMESMIFKSLLGYAVAFVVGGFAYRVLVRRLEAKFFDTREGPRSRGWVLLQWLSTGFLWSQWLMQDLANIFVYLPRPVSLTQLLLALVTMLVLFAILVRLKGGKIQQVVTSKSNLTDVRAATIVDLAFGLILFFFKELSNVPMSTTWVFLGLLAGREVALRRFLSERTRKQAWTMVGLDAGKAAIGLVVSVAVALLLPLFLD